MTFTTLTGTETKLEEGTYRLTKGGVTTPAIVREGKVKFLTRETILDGKVQYKRLN